MIVGTELSVSTSRSPSTSGAARGPATAALVVSSTRTISSGSVWCTQISSSDPLATRAGIQSPSSTGVHGLLDRDSVGGTRSSMKRKAAPSETVVPSELEMRSVLFPTTTRQYSSMSSSASGAQARNSDHHRVRACSVAG
jgi:hypothetical protein